MNTHNDALVLRNKAEDILKRKSSVVTSLPAESELLMLIHEFDVYQIELELQNAELNNAIAEARDAVDLYDFAPIGYFTLSKAGRITRLNLRGAAMLGRDRSVLGNRLFKSYVSYDTKPVFDHFLLAAYNNLAFQSCELTLLTDSQMPTYVQVTGIVTGEEDQCLVTVTDITKRRQAEAAILESEERYRFMFANNPEPMWVFDLETLVFLEVNQAAVVHYGYSVEEFLSMTLKDIRPVEDLPELMKNVAPTDRTYSQPGEFRHIKKNGEIINVLITWHAVIYKGRKARHVLVNDITRQKQAEDALVKEKWRLTSIIEGTNVGTWEWNVQTGEAFFNEQWAEITGYTLDELKPMNISVWEKSAHPDDLVQSNILLQQHFSGDLPYYDYECRVKHKDGRWIWVHDRGGVVTRTQDGKPLMMFGTHTNIDVRKRAEMDLQESELRFRSLFETSPSGVIVFDENGVILEANDAISKTTLYSHEELLKSNLGNLTFNYNQNAVAEHIRRILAGETVTHEVEVIKKDGTLSNLIVREASVILPGGKKGVLSVSNDITESKLIENALAESEEKYRNIFSIENDALFLIDNETHAILDTNDAACRLYGYTRDELLKLKNFELSGEPGKILQSQQEYQVRIELCYHKKKDGTVFPVDISASHLMVQGRQTILAAIRDITESKKTERQIQFQNEELIKVNAEKDKFFSIIAHDLRGPIGGFMGLTERMAEGMTNMTLDELQNIARIMKKSSANLYSLLGNLLEWSRMQRGLATFEPLRMLLLPKIHENMILVLDSAYKKEIAIGITIPADLQVYADVNMLSSIIRNLVANALKFTPKGGNINIAAGPEIKGFIEVSITDNGIGMNKNMVENLFNLDVNTSRKGTGGELSSGLGLIICKDLVEKQGGKLAVESEEGKGSTFKFTIPADSPL